MMTGLKLRNIRMFRSQVVTWEADIVGAPTALSNRRDGNPVPFRPDHIEVIQHNTDTGKLNGVVKLYGRNIRKDGSPGTRKIEATYSSTEATASIWQTLPAWTRDVIVEMRAATA